MWFIDKLNMHQDHESPLSIVGSERVIRVDIQTLEVLSDCPKSLIHEGSFSSSVTIRCNGTRVQVTGNPSRWNRAENLFGFTSIEDCVSVYNHILLTLGLPPFTKATIAQYRQSEDGKKVEVVTNDEGARVSVKGMDDVMYPAIASGIKKLDAALKHRKGQLKANLHEKPQSTAPEIAHEKVQEMNLA